MTQGTKVLLVVEGQIFEGKILTGSSSDSQLVSFIKNGQTCSTYKRVDELKVFEPSDAQLNFEIADTKNDNYEKAFSILQLCIKGINASRTLAEAKEFAIGAQQALTMCELSNEELSGNGEAPTHQGVGYHAEGSDMERTFGQN